MKLHLKGIDIVAPHGRGYHLDLVDGGAFLTVTGTEEDLAAVAAALEQVDFWKVLEVFPSSGLTAQTWLLTRQTAHALARMLDDRWAKLALQPDHA